jgi:DNA topoisomerase III
MLGSRVDKPGFTSILSSRTSDTFIPEYKEGERLDISNVKLTEGETHPPDYLTESEVIGLVSANKYRYLFSLLFRRLANCLL